jgi:hypothetical protein
LRDKSMGIKSSKTLFSAATWERFDDDRDGCGSLSECYLTDESIDLG